MDQETKIMKQKTILVSGGFDPVHVGHINHFVAAKKLGDELIVVLNNDNWLMQKKHYFFMNQWDRKKILKELRSVDQIILTQHRENCQDMSIAKILEKIKPDIYANGGDRKMSTIPAKEKVVCFKNNIKMVYGVGGPKIESSSELVKKANKPDKEFEKIKHEIKNGD